MRISILMAIVLATAAVFAPALVIAIADKAPPIVTTLLCMPLGAVIGFAFSVKVYDLVFNATNYNPPATTPAPMMGQIVPFRHLALPGAPREAA